MGFVDGIERYLHTTQELHVLVLIERLGSHIEQFRPPIAHIIHYLLYCCLVERRVQVMSDTLLFAKSIDDVHLILHQCDEG